MAIRCGISNLKPGRRAGQPGRRRLGPGSAEVIAEAPSAGTVLPLADFGTVSFTGATVDGAPIGGSANLSELIMESGAGGGRWGPRVTDSALLVAIYDDAGS